MYAAQIVAFNGEWNSNVHNTWFTHQASDPISTFEPNFQVRYKHFKAKIENQLSPFLSHIFWIVFPKKHCEKKWENPLESSKQKQNVYMWVTWIDK